MVVDPWKNGSLAGCELSLHLVNLKVEGKEPQMCSSLKEPHKKNITKPNQPIWYHLHNSPKRGFVGEELLVMPVHTELPPIS